MIKKLEENAREQNSFEKLKSDREVFRAFEIIELDFPTQDTIEKINKVTKDFNDLYTDFELEINIASEKSKHLDNYKSIQDLYLNLYLYNPNNVDSAGKFLPNFGYSNRLFHTWQNARAKHHQTFKNIFHESGISYDWNIPLIKHSIVATCNICNICTSTNQTKKLRIC